jgi:uncharacterized protein YhbP (UPF0306 family)
MSGPPTAYPTALLGSSPASAARQALARSISSSTLDVRGIAIEPEDAALLRDLLSDRQVLSLGVLVEERPYVGMLPYAVREDFGALIVHASRLARHSKGLLQGAAYSALIHAPDTPGVDAMQLARVTLQGDVNLLQAGGAEYMAARDLYLRKFPQSGMTFSLEDFQLYELRLKSGRLVSGFARTTNLNADHFRNLANV